ncbi:hypothetical protein C0993_006590 [Termitomyces sp. T159_Od127]|nr:hypothetical protein C0993_006590 [Termitomyces sp. T159_Od127]
MAVPQDSNPPQNDPHDRPRPEPLPGQPPRQPPAITACHRHQPPPLAASPLAITAVTATSALASAITPPIATTSAPVPATPVTPGPCRDPHHASRSRITADPTSARHAPLPLPSSPPRCRVSLRSQCETSTLCNMSQPHPARPPGLTPGPGATTRHWNMGLSPGPYLLRSI